MMDSITRLSFLPLDGDAPAHLELDSLPSFRAVATVVERAFRPFAIMGLEICEISASESLDDSGSGIHLLYIYGHAWLDNDALMTAVKTGMNSRVQSVVSLLTEILDDVDCDQLVIIFDCCHAAAAQATTKAFNPRLTVYGCGTEEKAIALTQENSSRLSLAFEEKLAMAPQSVNLTEVARAAAASLEADDVIRGQTVTVEAEHPPIQLTRKSKSPTSKRSTTVRRIRNKLVAVGGLVVAAMIAGGWFLRTHTLVQVDVGDLNTIATDIRIVGTLETPSRNGSKGVVEKSVSGTHVRFWVPSDNIVLRVVADFSDGESRGLALHQQLEPTLNFLDKMVTWKLPSADAVTAHPGMAYVPAAQWFTGREREPVSNDTTYWIDIRPPTLTEYLQAADRLIDQGTLRRADSLIFTARLNAAAINATGLEQLKELSGDLGAIFGALEAGTTEQVAAPGELALGLGDLACDDCPAPMTRIEAQLYCESRSMSLPTDRQWELAVRGIDGRTFPWGDQFDHKKANVPGLPDKGDPSPALKPVEDFALELSPFGLYDTVGNAGDWVINTQGAYEAVYMGATYRYNPEDATAFRLLPYTEETSLVREITARCVAG